MSHVTDGQIEMERIQVGFERWYRVGYNTVTNKFTTRANTSRFLFWRKVQPVNSDIRTDFDFVVQKIEEFVRTKKNSKQDLECLDNRIKWRITGLTERLTGFWSFFMFSSTKEKIRNSIEKFQNLRKLIQTKKSDLLQAEELKNINVEIAKSISWPDDILKTIFNFLPRKDACSLSKYFSQSLKVVDYINQSKIALKDLKELPLIFNFLKKYGKELHYLVLTKISFVMNNENLNKVFELCPNLTSLKIPYIKDFKLTGSNKLPKLQTLIFAAETPVKMERKDVLAFNDLPDLLYLQLEGNLCLQLSDIDTFLENKMHFQELCLVGKYWQSFHNSYSLKKQIKVLTLVGWDWNTVNWSLFANSSLRELVLSHHVVFPEQDSKQSFKNLINVLAQLPNLESLALSKLFSLYFIEESDSFTLPQLKFLSLYEPPCATEMSNIMDALPNLQKLTTLSFERMKVPELIEILPKLQQLKVLKIINLVNPAIHEVLSKNLKSLLIYSVKDYD